MRTRYVVYALLAAGCASGASRPALARVAPSTDGSDDGGSNEETSASLPEEATRVQRVESARGFVFHPSTPELHAFRFGVGGFYDAVDPQVMYGVQVRVPQLSLDARYGLGAGWSLKGHLNSMWVTNELLLGAAYAWATGRWSIEGAASAGVYFGKLAQLAFDAALVSPEYRPELTIGYDFGNVALALRGSLLLMGPERARVGEIWGGLDNSNLFVGHSEILYVENPTASGGVWYFGLGAMTTRAYYQFWLLFPDSPALFTYARAVAGYEF
jgi:hypothetical protein